MSGEWAATDTGSTMARLAPSAFAMLEGRLHGRPLAGDHDLARASCGWRRRRCRARDACSHKLRQARIVEADDRGHAALATGARRLHPAAALADEADGVGEIERAGGDEGRVLAHRVAGGEGGVGSVDLELRPAVTERRQVCDRGGQQRGLGVLGPVQVLLRSLPREAREGLAERLIGGAKTAAAAGDASARARPMPTDWRALAGEDEGDAVSSAPSVAGEARVQAAKSMHACRKIRSIVRSAP